MTEFYSLKVLLVSVVFLVQADGVLYTKCEADHECEQGFYCYKSNTCARCIDCSLYKREHPVSASCPRTAQECGHCQVGFKEDLHTNDRKKDLCIEAAESEISILWIMLIITVILFVLVVGTFCVRRHWWKDPDRTNERDPENVEVPPPYYLEPLVNLQGRDDRVETPVVSSEVETHNQFSQEKDHHLQEAVPFRTAEVPYEKDYGRKTPEPGTENGESSDTNPVSSRPASPALDDSGLSRSSCQTSSTSLRYFECFSSQSNSVPQQTVSGVRPRSESDDLNDVNEGACSSKRARRDSGTQSLDENVEESILHKK